MKKKETDFLFSCAVNFSFFDSDAPYFDISLVRCITEVYVHKIIIINMSSTFLPSSSSSVLSLPSCPSERGASASVLVVCFPTFLTESRCVTHSYASAWVEPLLFGNLLPISLD